MAEQEVKRVYQGIEVELQSNSWRFHVPELSNDFDTFEQAKGAIDRYVAEQSKVKRKKLAIATVSESGNSFVVTGIHAGHNGIVVTPKRERWGGGDHYLFVNVPWIVEAIREKAELELKARRIWSAISEFQIADNYRGEIVAATAELERDAAAKLRAAEKTTLSAELAKVKADDI